MAEHPRWASYACDIPGRAPCPCALGWGQGGTPGCLVQPEKLGGSWCLHKLVKHCISPPKHVLPPPIGFPPASTGRCSTSAHPSQQRGGPAAGGSRPGGQVKERGGKRGRCIRCRVLVILGPLSNGSPAASPAASLNQPEPPRCCPAPAQPGHRLCAPVREGDWNPPGAACCTPAWAWVCAQEEGGKGPTSGSLAQSFLSCCSKMCPSKETASAVRGEGCSRRMGI